MRSLTASTVTSIVQRQYIKHWMKSLSLVQSTLSFSSIDTNCLPFPRRPSPSSAVILYFPLSNISGFRPQRGTSKLKMKACIFLGLLSLALTAVVEDTPVTELPSEDSANLNAEFISKTLKWITADGTERIPDSPSKTTVTDLTFDAVDEAAENTTQAGNGTVEIDLKTGGTPPYCQCRNKYYCLPPQRKAPSKTERAINTPLCQRDEVMCCSTGGPGCGISTPFPEFYPYPSYGEAHFAEYPWTAIVMDTSNQFIFGLGVIVTPNLILTAARNIEPYIGTALKVRVGEWDLATNEEPFKPIEFSVKEAVIHPKYDKRTFQNDLALLRLRVPIDVDKYPSVRAACLIRPQDAPKFNSARCWTAGWGIKPADRGVQEPHNLLKEVDLTILDPRSCEAAIRRSIGNPQYYLDQQSFLCAGGEPGKGLCKGDEGAALVCQDGPGGRYTVVGLSSWGTSCGQSGFPGIFTNLATQFDWIRSIELSAGQKFSSG